MVSPVFVPLPDRRYPEQDGLGAEWIETPRRSGHRGRSEHDSEKSTTKNNNGMGASLTRIIGHYVV